MIDTYPSCCADKQADHYWVSRVEVQHVVIAAEALMAATQQDIMLCKVYTKRLLS